MQPTVSAVALTKVDLITNFSRFLSACSLRGGQGVLADVRVDWHYQIEELLRMSAFAFRRLL